MTFSLIISLLTLTFMEIVLGIDNLVFISISTDRLPHDEQPRARFIGIGLALLVRIMLLMTIAWIVGLVHPVATINLPHWIYDKTYNLSWRDLILFAGGLFLIAKSTSEIHGKITDEAEGDHVTKTSAISKVIMQIVLLDIVFSFDSILTAIGLIKLPADGDLNPLDVLQFKEFWLMVTAVVIAMAIMLMASNKVADFINQHPTVKILALAFLLLIGFMLVLEGLHIEVPKGYIYFAIFFSLLVELINMRVRKRQTKPAGEQ